MPSGDDSHAPVPLRRYPSAFHDSAEHEAALAAFPAEFYPAWVKACRRLAGAGYGGTVADDYQRLSPQVAQVAGPQQALELASAASGLAIRAGRGPAALLIRASSSAAKRLRDNFSEWLALVDRTAIHAPESMSAILERTDLLLSHLDLNGLESWLRIGIRAANGDPQRRRRFFTLEDPEAQHWLQRESGVVGFLDFETRLKPYLTALWGLSVPLREVPPDAPEQVKRRPGFDGAVMRLPASFPGFSASDSESLYRAAVAHIGAHCTFTRAKFPVGGLKPAQIALVSLIEDARVEHLAMRALPGLRNLFVPFHVAQPSGPSTAPNLFARLSRALLDRAHDDPDGWVRKGRDAFFAAEAEWQDQRLSRRIGDLLGNDLGQMRIQFDQRSYIVQPAYRDDNLGLWDFGEDEQQTLNAEQVFESARLRQEEDDSRPPDREETEQRPDETAGRLTAVESAAGGVPVARYPEFDYVTGRDRPEWTTVKEYPVAIGRVQDIAHLREERSDIVNRLTTLIRAARVSRAERLRRQPEGEFLDMDACIDATIARRVGEVPRDRVYGRYERRSRDLSTLLLLDTSKSTAEFVRGSARTVLDIERQAAALLAYAMSELGDPFAVAAFASDQREDVRYLRIKDFGEEYDRTADARLAGLGSGLSTRLGAAIRHAGTDLSRQRSYRRLLLVVTDGEPSDVDVDDDRYLVEDARKAVFHLRRLGIDVYCVGLDTEARPPLDRIFGSRNAITISRLESLPELLPTLYLSLRK
ncbi:nitric oxide reductase activation protein NorD [Mesorhizobium sp. LHD-90]|uniref:nitric oxide reductase activation protein NorD n=1 Tax=Mesorhizobium sp. LHD-90 TaxID=3071414 RepID=UPI0027E06F0A|nr:nitric oxide reductase activation protein NorD [Mesorhizobium sp. LHD-90]MDQ6437534.1 nitric oxide reductase activation protein NorD [Mesorhizobium sp. LHD-90]